MGAILGQAWKKWGSEQVASNYVLANSKEMMPLPIHKYLGYYPQKEWFNFHNASLIHFIGKYRFENNFYMDTARRFINIIKG